MKPSAGRRGLACGALLTVAVVAVAGAAALPPAAQDRVVEITVEAKDFAFTPSRIEVDAGALVKIRLVAGDIPHTLTIDAYRIAKKARPGSDAVIEFCAQTRGTFVFYCSLTDDPRCRGMQGHLVVR